MRTGMEWRRGVRLAWSASRLDVALRRAAHLRGGDAPALRVTQTGGEEIVDQPCHGPAQPPAFMIQCADDDPVDAGRITRSPWHGGWMRCGGDEFASQFSITRMGGELQAPQESVLSVATAWAMLAGRKHPSKKCSIKRRRMPREAQKWD